jgi:hypothetical protein
VAFSLGLQHPRYATLGGHVMENEPDGTTTTVILVIAGILLLLLLAAGAFLFLA